MSKPWPWHAAQLLQYSTIPVISLDEAYSPYTPFSDPDEKQDIVNWAEELDNILRQQRLSVTMLAKRLGIDRSTLAHVIQLKNLTPYGRRMLRAEEISVGHAKRLAYSDYDTQDNLILWMLEQDNLPSVRDLEKRRKDGSAEKATVSLLAQAPAKDVNTIKLERLIGEYFGCPVTIENGSLMLNFYAENELLDGILEKAGIYF